MKELHKEPAKCRFFCVRRERATIGEYKCHHPGRENRVGSEKYV